jgi:hypothetical protein
MAFKVGDIVRLLQDRAFGDQVFQAGSLGTIAATLSSMDACLVALGHDTTTRLVPNSALELVKKTPGAGTQAAATLAAGLRFSVGDRVKLRSERRYGDVIHPKGTPGTVRAELATLLSYLVDLDTDATDRIVPDSALDSE